MYRNENLTVKAVYRYNENVTEVELELEKIVQELLEDEEVEIIWL